MTGGGFFTFESATGLPTGLPTPGQLTAQTERWRDVLTEFRNYLQRVCESQIVRSDKEAQKIILGMARCRNMTEVNAQMDRLVLRIGTLLAAKTGDKTELTRLVSQARERGRAALTRSSKYHAFSDQGETERPARVMIKF